MASELILKQQLKELALKEILKLGITEAEATKIAPNFGFEIQPQAIGIFVDVPHHACLLGLIRSMKMICPEYHLTPEMQAVVITNSQVDTDTAKLIKHIIGHTKQIQIYQEEYEFAKAALKMIGCNLVQIENSQKIVYTIGCRQIADMIGITPAELDWSKMMYMGFNALNEDIANIPVQTPLKYDDPDKLIRYIAYGMFCIVNYQYQSACFHESRLLSIPVKSYEARRRQRDALFFVSNGIAEIMTLPFSEQVISEDSVLIHNFKYGSMRRKITLPVQKMPYFEARFEIGEVFYLQDNKPVQQRELAIIIQRSSHIEEILFKWLFFNKMPSYALNITNNQIKIGDDHVGELQLVTDTEKMIEYYAANINYDKIKQFRDTVDVDTASRTEDVTIEVNPADSFYTTNERHKLHLNNPSAKQIHLIKVYENKLTYKLVY